MIKFSFNIKAQSTQNEDPRAKLSRLKLKIIPKREAQGTTIWQRKEFFFIQFCKNLVCQNQE